ncbi:MAG: hypothetical protein V4691_00815 [Pseudomonadota bacterium]
MTDAVFLSASVPDPKRCPHYAQTADSVAITAAVSALIYVTLGRRLLVWGGHPAITPMIWSAAEALDVDYSEWVKLYQSNFFEDEFPEENKNFRNVTYIEKFDQDLPKSLLAMRTQMFSDYEFSSAIFIGGMNGIIDEFDLIQALQPKASIVPILSAGGAALEVAKHLSEVSNDLINDLDYISLFHRHLGISFKEQRYRRPSEQPVDIKQRYRPNA